MNKHAFLSVLLALILVFGCVGVAHAQIIQPEKGDWQIGPMAFVLCEKLTLRAEPSGSAAKIETLEYGFRPIDIEQKDNWAYVTLGDSEDSTKGWLNADYLAINPAWYRTESKTTVYAWNDTGALKVGLLDADTTLPILKQDGDWILVSLRGAAGWIRL